MTKQDVEASNDVMTSTLSIFSRDAKVLFDSSVTHLFISIAFAYHANRSTESLECYLFVAPPIGDNMIMNQVYKSCFISFGDREFLVDLLPIVMYAFDVILGMDWLATNHLVLTASLRRLYLKFLEKYNFDFMGIRRITKV